MRLYKSIDLMVIRNPMFTKPKRFKYVQEAATRILDSAMFFRFGGHNLRKAGEG